MTEWLHLHFSLSCIGEVNGNPLQCSCLENPRDGGAWWAAVYGVTQSRTQLKRLSSSSSMEYLSWIAQFRYLKIVAKKKKKEGKRKVLLLSPSSMSDNNHCEHLTTDSPHSPIVSTNNYTLIYLLKIYAEEIIFHAPFFPFLLSLNDMLETHSYQHTLNILISLWLHHVLPCGCALIRVTTTPKTLDFLLS